MSNSGFQSQDARYEMRKLADLKQWDDNPREWKEDSFARLQEQIRKLGVYKPLIVNQNNIILGGNQRYEALVDLGVDEVMCAIVLTDNQQQMIEYALSDNDHTGTTDEQKLAELVTITPIEMPLFAVSVGRLKPVEAVLKAVSPDGSDDTDQSPKEQACRHCPIHCEKMEN